MVVNPWIYGMKSLKQFLPWARSNAMNDNLGDPDKETSFLAVLSFSHTDVDYVKLHGHMESWGFVKAVASQSDTEFSLLDACYLYTSAARETLDQIRARLILALRDFKVLNQGAGEKSRFVVTQITGLMMDELAPLPAGGLRG
jgi:hypothetical protein